MLCNYRKKAIIDEKNTKSQKVNIINSLNNCNVI